MLAQLHCRSFRNLRDSRWQPGPGCHLVLGPNGAGKTSLLEAVYLLATTRSFRTAQVLDCRRHGSPDFHLEGEVEADQRVRLRVGLGSSGRYRGVNGRVTGLVDHLRVLPLVAWTTADRELISGPPAARRRFLDQGIVGARPAALEVLARFRRVLSHKRRLLAEGGAGLQSWNEVFARVSGELMALRRDYLQRLSAALSEILADQSMDLPDLRLDYRPSIQEAGESCEQVLAALQKVQGQEEREKRPVVGPQRDELVISWGSHSVRRIGSAGERKILGLLLTVARGRVLARAQRRPIFLLDDADTDLDEERLAAIWRVLRGARQVFVSSSREAVWSVAPEAVRWHLAAGRLSPGKKP